MTELKTELASVIRSLGECQEFLTRTGNGEAAQLIALALLEVRMRVHRVADAELKALCDTVVAERSRPTPEAGEQRRPIPRPAYPPLRAVK